MVTQLALVLEGEANKADGMARAWDAANTDWKAAATAIVRHLAETRAEFTADQVWAELDALGFATREHRAMGAVMRAAAVDGLIVKTDRVTPTSRPCANRRPVAVWQSLLTRTSYAPIA
jgi:hypothetical protein